MILLRKASATCSVVSAVTTDQRSLLRWPRRVWGQWAGEGDVVPYERITRCRRKVSFYPFHCGSGWKCRSGRWHVKVLRVHLRSLLVINFCQEILSCLRKDSYRSVTSLWRVTNEKYCPIHSCVRFRKYNFFSRSFRTEYTPSNVRRLFNSRTSR